MDEQGSDCSVKSTTAGAAGSTHTQLVESFVHQPRQLGEESTVVPWWKWLTQGFEFLGLYEANSEASEASGELKQERQMRLVREVEKVKRGKWSKWG